MVKKVVKKGEAEPTVNFDEILTSRPIPPQEKTKDQLYGNIVRHFIDSKETFRFVDVAKLNAMRNSNLQATTILAGVSTYIRKSNLQKQVHLVQRKAMKDKGFWIRVPTPEELKA